MHKRGSSQIQSARFIRERVGCVCLCVLASVCWCVWYVYLWLLYVNCIFKSALCIYIWWSLFAAILSPHTKLVASATALSRARNRAEHTASLPLPLSLSLNRGSTTHRKHERATPLSLYIDIYVVVPSIYIYFDREFTEKVCLQFGQWLIIVTYMLLYMCHHYHHIFVLARNRVC